MASVTPCAPDLLEPARKRQRFSPQLQPRTVRGKNNTLGITTSEVQTTAQKSIMSRNEREGDAGILCFVNESNPGFSGILKQRYTDFLVNEITMDGNVVHLTDTNVPKRKAAPMNQLHRKSPSYIVESLITEDKTVVSLPEAAAKVPSDNVSQIGIEGAAPGVQETTGFVVSTDDMTLLESYFGSEVQVAILKLHEKVLKEPQTKPGLSDFVTSDPITDRGLRGKIHQDMRRIFNSRLETATGAKDVITISVTPKIKPQGRLGQSGSSRDSGRNQKSKGRLNWKDLGGDHLHFSLYKENKDTMEVISYISSQLRTTPRQFSFAGTKDRRGVTVQRISVYHVYAEALAGLNRTLRGSKVGNFTYEKQRLELGDLMGNEFLITLRDCTFGESEAAYGEEKLALANRVVGAAMQNMQTHGFINYYGLQRFGTYSVGTDVVGKKILQGDFEGAVNAILVYNDDALACALDPEFVPADGKPLPRDDIARAEGLHLFKTTGESQAALEKLPRKFSGESSIVRYLNRNRNDFVGALLQIPRNLRLMYVHAYQSLVWNMAASERWTRYRDKVIKGDLVIVDSKYTKLNEGSKESEVDANGEIIVLPSAGDAAISHADLWERARPLTAKEAEIGEYSIFDVVLPTPGYDIEYPDNDIGDYYKEFMTSERGGALDPGNMRRAQQDFSLSGSYRKLLAHIGSDVTYEVKSYTDDNEQMVETDLEKITKSRIDFGSREPSNQNREVRNNGGGRRDRQNYKDHEARQKNGDDFHPENHAAQRAAWKNFPVEIAEEEKAQADLANAQRAAGSKLPRTNVPQPAYKETYIETSSKDGKRTGHRETTIMPGVEGTAFETHMDDDEVAVNPVATGKKADYSTEANRKQPIHDLSTTPLEKANHDLELEPKSQSTAIKARELKREEDTSPPTPSYTITNADQSSPPEKELADHDMKDLEEPQVLPEPQKAKEKIAVILKFQLGSSQYATMALRELMKQGGVQTYKPEYGSR